MTVKSSDAVTGASGLTRSAPNRSRKAAVTRSVTASSLRVSGKRSYTSMSGGRGESEATHSARTTRSIAASRDSRTSRSEEHTSELQSRGHLVCRLLLEKKNEIHKKYYPVLGRKSAPSLSQPVARAPTV